MYNIQLYCSLRHSGVGGRRETSLKYATINWSTVYDRRRYYGSVSTLPSHLKCINHGWKFGVKLGVSRGTACAYCILNPNEGAPKVSSKSDKSCDHAWEADSADRQTDRCGPRQSVHKTSWTDQYSAEFKKSTRLICYIKTWINNNLDWN